MKPKVPSLLFPKKETDLPYFQLFYWTIFYNRHPNASTEAYSKVDRDMRRKRAKINPPDPKTLKEFGSYLEDDKYRQILKFPKGELTVKVLEDENGDTSVVLGDRGLIETLLPIIEPGVAVFADATFDSAPANLKIYQLLEIQLCVFDHVSTDYCYLGSYSIGGTFGAEEM